MKKTFNLFFKRNLKVVGNFFPKHPSNDENKLNKRRQLIATIQENIKNMGFVLGEGVIKTLINTSESEIKKFYFTLKDILTDVLGDYKFEPMYVNFPREVMEMDEALLYYNAILHYLDKIVGFKGLEEYQIKEEKEERFPLSFDDIDLKVIELATFDDVKNEFINLIQSETSISNDDAEFIKTFIEESNEEDLLKIFKNVKVIFLEIKVLLYKQLKANKMYKAAKLFQPKQPNEILKFIFKHFNYNTIDIAHLKKNLTFKRAFRREVLEMIDNANIKPEDAKRHIKIWIRLGEFLHPGEYRNRYPNAFKLFDELRNNAKNIRTFYSQVNELKNKLVKGTILPEETIQLIRLLLSRPGELARNVIMLMKYSDPQDIVDAFELVIQDVPTNIILSIIGLLKSNQKYRIFRPKNGTRGLYIKENDGNKIGTELLPVLENELRRRFAKVDWYKKPIYLDEELKNHIIPFQQRTSNSTKLYKYTKGTRIPLGDVKNDDVLRFFVYWENKDEDTRVDIDLSVAFLNENFGIIDRLSYYNLKPEKFSHVAIHSGDITDAPNGAAEFIDLRIGELNDVKYVVIGLNSYLGIPFEMFNCYFGWMRRDKLGEEGEIFEPSTVEGRIDIISDKINNIPVIINLETNTIYFADFDTTLSEITIDGIGPVFKPLIDSIENINQISMYDLFKYHIDGSHAVLVDNKEDAELVIGKDGDITPFDITTIMGEYMK